jgi:hypothetical protein
VTRLSHALDRIDATFDDPNLVADAGLLLVATLSQRLGLEALVNATVRLVGRVGEAFLTLRDRSGWYSDRIGGPLAGCCFVRVVVGFIAGSGARLGVVRRRSVSRLGGQPGWCHRGLRVRRSG